MQLAEFDERMALLVDLRRLVPRMHVDHAARGLGKTSLLRAYQARAIARGVVTVWVTAGEAAGLVAQIADGIRRAADSWSNEVRQVLSERIERVSVSVGVPGFASADASLRPASRSQIPAGARPFEDLIRTTVAKSSAPGLMIFIDEIQSADAEGLRTLLYAWQHLQAEGDDVPAAVFAAGLPNTPDVITSIITFSERVAFRPLGALTPDAAEIAIRLPAQAIGVQWNASATASALSIASGYPYSLQLIADASWIAAGRPDAGGVVTAQHVEIGREAMRADIEALFRSRWAAASGVDRQMMTAMANVIGRHPGDGEAVRRSAVATEMGLSVHDLSVPRARLIDKGLIQAAGHGLLEFTIPGFAEFVRELDA